jgi:hypothetical protein
MTLSQYILFPLISKRWFWLWLYANRHRSILGAVGHIIPTPANQLMVFISLYNNLIKAQNMVTYCFTPTDTEAF